MKEFPKGLWDKRKRCPGLVSPDPLQTGRWHPFGSAHGPPQVIQIPHRARASLTSNALSL